MLVLAVVLASAICLVLGVTSGPFLLVWVALGLSLAGLILIALPLLRRLGGVEPSAAGVSEDGGASEDSGAAAPATIDDGRVSRVGEVAADQEAATEPSVVGSGGSPAATGVSAGSGATEAQCDEPSADGVEGGDVALSGSAAQEAEVGEIATGAAASTGVTVVVVPGRRRFHRPECDLVAGRSMEQVHVEEAADEGFSACTTCIPDRAAIAAHR